MASASGASRRGLENALISRACSDIVILLTDIDLPGSMNGLMLAWVVRDRWPLRGIVIVSGYRTARDADMPVRGLFSESRSRVGRS